MIDLIQVDLQGILMLCAYNCAQNTEKGEVCMRKYEELEIEVKAIQVNDIISTSPTDIGQDTPGIGMDDDMLS